MKLQSFQELGDFISPTPSPHATHTVWAKLNATKECKASVREFLQTELDIDAHYHQSKLHLTVYHARRPLPGLVSFKEKVYIEVPAEHFRLMAMAPGGENPRPDIEMGEVSIGLRLHRRAPQVQEILSYRARFYALETMQVIGARAPSNDRRSAFGARSYQPHITLIRKGSGLDPDLTKAGRLFRESGLSIVFDRFVVECGLATK